MKAKIRDIGFALDVIVVGVDCYLEEGEFGYENCWVDVPDYPATETEPNPPTHKELVPFRSLSIALPTDTTKEQAVATIKTKLEGFKRAHNRIQQAQQFIGTEIKV